MKKVYLLFIVFFVISLTLFYSLNSSLIELKAQKELLVELKVQKELLEKDVNLKNSEIESLNKDNDSKSRRINNLNKLIADLLIRLEKPSYKLLPESEIRNGLNITFFNIMGSNLPISDDSENYLGTGYIDFDQNNTLIYVSSSGLTFKFNLKEKIFTKIDNNFFNKIDFIKVSKNLGFSIKDSKITENFIYISYTKEIREGCWNMAIARAKINYDFIKFNDFFVPKKCVDENNNEFEALQSGGRIEILDKNNLLFSIGEFRDRNLAQNLNSINGKILKINILDKSSTIISMGHRNPQGLYYDKKNNLILSTEHGPYGGDEINLIHLNNENIPNFGWPISSYGDHYGNPDENIEKIKKFPLYNSHKNYGFIEPLHYFPFSIGASEITKIGSASYAVSSLRGNTSQGVGRSLYLFQMKDEQIINLTQFKIGERIRDLKYKNDKLYMFLEDSSSIATIDTNKLIELMNSKN